MMFKLTMTSGFNVGCDDDEVKKYQSVGFTFEKKGNYWEWQEEFDDNLYVRIDTLEELMELKNKFDRLILESNEDENIIEIYNDWRE